MKKFRNKSKANSNKKNSNGIKGMLFKNFVDVLPFNVAIINKEGDIIFANNKLVLLSGYDEKLLLSKKIYELCFSYSKEEFFNKIMNQNKQAGVVKDGKVIPVEITIMNINLGREEYIFCFIQDLTEQKKIEAQLLHNNSFLKSIISKAADGICVCHDIPDYPFVKFTVWNDKMTEITGYTMEEINKYGWYQSMYPDPDVQKKAVERMKRMRLGDDIIKEEWRITCKDGSKKDLLISTAVLASADGKTHVMALMQDITQQKITEAKRLEMQQSLLHIQKLESLGILAGGIAHDFNNILMAILGNLDLAMLDMDPDSPAYYYIEQCLKATHRACELTRQMLAYSGKGRFVIENVNISKIIEDNLVILKTSINKRARLELDLQMDLPFINVDVDQLRQVIVNLVLNASEAIGDKQGKILIRTGIEYFDENSLEKNHLRDKLSAGDYVFIEVSDTGVGMSEEILSRVCEPFFTTKFVGRGLGMAAVAGIIRGHRGGLFIQSEMNKGTAVKVIFPVSDYVSKEKIVSEEGKRGEEKAVFSGTILIVDDEKIVRDILVKMVGHLGFESITANDGFEAIELFKKNLDIIRCIILDLTMPGIDGITTFKELVKIKPDVKVILASGYSEQIAMQRIDSIAPAGFLQKPYKLDQLKEMLSSVI